MTREKLRSELERLLKDATPAPWTSDGEIEPWWGGEQPACRVAHAMASNPNMSEPVCMCPAPRWEAENRPLADAELIALLRNNADALLAALASSSDGS